MSQAPVRFPSPEDFRDAGPVELASALISIPSVNPSLEADGSGEAEISDFCEALLRAWGFQTEIWEWAPGRCSVLARMGESGSPLILNGHLDTVGIRGMSIAPFDPRMEGGQLFGRGSCDMKAGVAAVLCVARAFAERRETLGLRGALCVLLTSDEEYASQGLARLLESGIRGEVAVVCEPTSLEVMPANKGFQWWEVDFQGRAAHGSRPDEGRDAIRAAGRFLTGLDTLENAWLADPPHPLLGHSSLHAGTIRGGTGPSIYPAQCRLVLEVRSIPGMGTLGVEQGLRDLAGQIEAQSPGVQVHLRKTLERPSADLAVGHPLVEAIVAACRDRNLPGTVSGMTAWVESAWFQQAGIPSLCFGPGSMARAHTDDESIPVAEIPVAVDVLTDFMERWMTHEC